MNNTANHRGTQPSVLAANDATIVGDSPLSGGTANTASSTATTTTQRLLRPKLDLLHRMYYNGRQSSNDYMANVGGASSGGGGGGGGGNGSGGNASSAADSAMNSGDASLECNKRILDALHRRWRRGRLQTTIHRAGFVDIGGGGLQSSSSAAMLQRHKKLMKKKRRQSIRNDDELDDEQWGSSSSDASSDTSDNAATSSSSNSSVSPSSSPKNAHGESVAPATALTGVGGSNASGGGGPLLIPHPHSSSSSPLLDRTLVFNQTFSALTADSHANVEAREQQQQKQQQQKSSVGLGTGATTSDQRRKKNKKVSRSGGGGGGINIFDLAMIVTKKAEDINDVYTMGSNGVLRLLERRGGEPSSQDDDNDNDDDDDDHHHHNHDNSGGSSHSSSSSSSSATADDDGDDGVTADDNSPFGGGADGFASFQAKLLSAADDNDDPTPVDNDEANRNAMGGVLRGKELNNNKNIATSSTNRSKAKRRQSVLASAAISNNSGGHSPSPSAAFRKRFSILSPSAPMNVEASKRREKRQEEKKRKRAELTAQTMAVRAAVDSRWAAVIQKSPLQRLTPQDVEELRVAWLMAAVMKRANVPWRTEVKRRLEGIGLVDRAKQQQQQQDQLVITNTSAKSQQKQQQMKVVGGGGALSSSSSRPASPDPAAAASAPAGGGGGATDGLSAATTPLPPPPTATTTGDDSLHTLAATRSEIPPALLLEIFAKHNYYQHLGEDGGGGSSGGSSAAAVIAKNQNSPFHKRQLREEERELQRQAPTSLAQQLKKEQRESQQQQQQQKTTPQNLKQQQQQQQQEKGRSASSNNNSRHHTVAAANLNRIVFRYKSPRDAAADAFIVNDAFNRQIYGITLTDASNNALLGGGGGGGGDGMNTSSASASAGLDHLDPSKGNSTTSSYLNIPPTIPKHILEGLPTLNTELSQPEFATVLKDFLIRSGTFDERGMKQSLYQLLVQIVKEETLGMGSTTQNEQRRTATNESSSSSPSPKTGGGGVTFAPTMISGGISGGQLASNAALYNKNTKNNNHNDTGAPSDVEQIRSGVSRGTELASFLHALFTAVDTARRYNVSWDDFLTHLLAEVYGIEADSRHSAVGGLTISTKLLREEMAAAGGIATLLFKEKEKRRRRAMMMGAGGGADTDNESGSPRSLRGKPLIPSNDNNNNGADNDDDEDAKAAHYRDLAIASTKSTASAALERLKHVKSKIDSLPPTAIAAEYMRRKRELKRIKKEELKRRAGVAGAAGGGGGGLFATAAAGGDGNNNNNKDDASGGKDGAISTDGFGIVEKQGYTLSYPSYAVHKVTTLRAFPQWQAVVAVDGKCAAIFSYKDVDAWGQAGVPTFNETMMSAAAAAANASATIGGSTNARAMRGGGGGGTAADEGFDDFHQNQQQRDDAAASADGPSPNRNNNNNASSSQPAIFKSAFVRRDDDVVGGGKYLQFEGKIMSVECLYRDRLLIFAIGEREQLHLFHIGGGGDEGKSASSSGTTAGSGLVAPSTNLRFIGKFELPLFSLEFHEKLEKDQQMKAIKAKAEAIARGNLLQQQQHSHNHHHQNSNGGQDGSSASASGAGAGGEEIIATTNTNEEDGLNDDRPATGSMQSTTALPPPPSNGTGRTNNSRAPSAAATLPSAANNKSRRPASISPTTNQRRSGTPAATARPMNMNSSSTDAATANSKGNNGNGRTTTAAASHNKAASMTMSVGLTTITCLRVWRDNTNAVVGFGGSGSGGGSSMLLLGGTRDGIFFGLSVHDVDGMRRNGAQILFQYRLHTAPINDICVLPNSGRVVTCSLDGKLLSHIPNGAGRAMVVDRPSTSSSSTSAAASNAKGGGGKNNVNGSSSPMSTSASSVSIAAAAASLLAAPLWKRSLIEYVGGHERSITALAYCGDHEATASKRTAMRLLAERRDNDPTAAAASADANNPNGGKKNKGGVDGGGASSSSGGPLVVGNTSNSGEVFVSGGLEFKVFCWTDTMTRPLLVLTDAAAPIHSPIVRLLSVPNTPLLYIVDASGMVKLFDVRNGRPLGTWKTGGGSGGGGQSSSARGGGAAGGNNKNALDSQSEDSELEGEEGGASQALPSLQQQQLQREKRRQKAMMMGGGGVLALLNNSKRRMGSAAATSSSSGKGGARGLFLDSSGGGGAAVLSACYTGSTHRTILFGANVISKFHTETRTDYSNRASHEAVIALGISRSVIITVAVTAIRMWSAHTGKVISTHSTDTYSVAPTASAAVDSCGGIVFLGKENGFVEAFDITDGQMLRRYCYHTSSVVGIQLDLDCGLIVSAGRGGDVCVWRNYDAKTHGAYVGAADPTVLAAKRVRYGITDDIMGDLHRHDTSKRRRGGGRGGGKRSGGAHSHSPSSGVVVGTTAALVRRRLSILAGGDGDESVADNIFAVDDGDDVDEATRQQRTHSRRQSLMTGGSNLSFLGAAHPATTTTTQRAAADVDDANGGDEDEKNGNFGNNPRPIISGVTPKGKPSSSQQRYSGNRRVVDIIEKSPWLGIGDDGLSSTSAMCTPIALQVENFRHSAATPLIAGVHGSAGGGPPPAPPAGTTTMRGSFAVSIPSTTVNSNSSSSSSSVSSSSPAAASIAVGATTDPMQLTSRIGAREQSHRTQLCNEARLAWWSYHRWRRLMHKRALSRNYDPNPMRIVSFPIQVVHCGTVPNVSGGAHHPISALAIDPVMMRVGVLLSFNSALVLDYAWSGAQEHFVMPHPINAASAANPSSSSSATPPTANPLQSATNKNNNANKKADAAAAALLANASRRSANTAVTVVTHRTVIGNDPSAMLGLASICFGGNLLFTSDVQGMVYAWVLRSNFNYHHPNQRQQQQQQLLNLSSPRSGGGAADAEDDGPLLLLGSPTSSAASISPPLNTHPTAPPPAPRLAVYCQHPTVYKELSAAHSYPVKSVQHSLSTSAMLLSAWRAHRSQATIAKERYKRQQKRRRDAIEAAKKSVLGRAGYTYNANHQNNRSTDYYGSGNGKKKRNIVGSGGGVSDLLGNSDSESSFDEKELVDPTLSDGELREELEERLLQRQQKEKEARRVTADALQRRNHSPDTMIGGGIANRNGMRARQRFANTTSSGVAGNANTNGGGGAHHQQQPIGGSDCGPIPLRKLRVPPAYTTTTDGGFAAGSLDRDREGAFIPLTAGRNAAQLLFQQQMSEAAAATAAKRSNNNTNNNGSPPRPNNATTTHNANGGTATPSSRSGLLSQSARLNASGRIGGGGGGGGAMLLGASTLNADYDYEGGGASSSSPARSAVTSPTMGLPPMTTNSQQQQSARGGGGKSSSSRHNNHHDNNNIHDMLATIVPHVTSLYFDRNRATLITGDDTGEVHLWEIEPMFTNICANPRRSTLLRVSRLDGIPSSAGGGDVSAPTTARAAAAAAQSHYSSAMSQEEIDERRRQLFGERIVTKPTGVPPRHVYGWKAADGSPITLAAAIPPTTSWNFCGMLTIAGDSSVLFWNMGGDEVAALRQGPVVDRVWDIPNNWLLEKVGLIRCRWLKFINGVHDSYLTGIMKAKEEEQKREILMNRNRRLQHQQQQKLIEEQQQQQQQQPQQESPRQQSGTAATHAHGVGSCKPIGFSFQRTPSNLGGASSPQRSTPTVTIAAAADGTTINSTATGSSALPPRLPRYSPSTAAGATATATTTSPSALPLPPMTAEDTEKFLHRNAIAANAMHDTEWIRIDGDLLESILVGHWLSHEEATRVRAHRVDLFKARQRAEAAAMAAQLNKRSASMHNLGTNGSSGGRRRNSAAVSSGAISGISGGGGGGGDGGGGSIVGRQNSNNRSNNNNNNYDDDHSSSGNNNNVNKSPTSLSVVVRTISGLPSDGGGGGNVSSASHLTLTPMIPSLAVEEANHNLHQGGEGEKKDNDAAPPQYGFEDGFRDISISASTSPGVMPLQSIVSGASHPLTTRPTTAPFVAGGGGAGQHHQANYALPSANLTATATMSIPINNATTNNRHHLLDDDDEDDDDLDMLDGDDIDGGSAGDGGSPFSTSRGKGAAHRSSQSKFVNPILQHPFQTPHRRQKAILGGFVGQGAAAVSPENAAATAAARRRKAGKYVAINENNNDNDGDGNNNNGGGDPNNAQTDGSSPSKAPAAALPARRALTQQVKPKMQMASRHGIALPSAAAAHSSPPSQRKKVAVGSATATTGEGLVVATGDYHQNNDNGNANGSMMATAAVVGLISIGAQTQRPATAVIPTVPITLDTLIPTGRTLVLPPLSTPLPLVSSPSSRNENGGGGTNNSNSNPLASPRGTGTGGSANAATSSSAAAASSAPPPINSNTDISSEAALLNAAKKPTILGRIDAAVGTFLCLHERARPTLKLDARVRLQTAPAEHFGPEAFAVAHRSVVEVNANMNSNTTTHTTSSNNNNNNARSGDDFINDSKSALDIDSDEEEERGDDKSPPKKRIEEEKTPTAHHRKNQLLKSSSPAVASGAGAGAAAAVGLQPHEHYAEAIQRRTFFTPQPMRNPPPNLRTPQPHHHHQHSSSISTGGASLLSPIDRRSVVGGGNNNAVDESIAAKQLLQSLNAVASSPQQQQQLNLSSTSGAAAGNNTMNSPSSSAPSATATTNWKQIRQQEREEDQVRAMAIPEVDSRLLIVPAKMPPPKPSDYQRTLRGDTFTTPIHPMVKGVLGAVSLGGRCGTQTAILTAIPRTKPGETDDPKQKKKKKH